MIRQSQLLRAARFEATKSATARHFASSAQWPTGRAGPCLRLTNEDLYRQLVSSHIVSRHRLWYPNSQASFSTSSQALAISFRDLKGESKSEAPKSAEEPKSTSSENTVDPAEEAYQAAKSESEKEWEKFKAQAQKEKEQEAENTDSQNGEQQKQRKGQEQSPPPPPPPDSRSPWQVFTETLRSEFQASKEWNESTKALSAGAHQFTENESVKRARAAYTAASGAASSGTASALKGAGRSIGAGAAWTWDTPIVRGVRQGVSATGRAIDSATKPVRETKAFQSVKNVIDDGSSSKYGGWMEKEERRRQREVRELEEAATTGRPGRRVERVEEDPK